MKSIAAMALLLCVAARASTPAPEHCTAWGNAVGVIATMRDGGTDESDVALKILGDSEECRGQDKCVVYDRADMIKAGAMVHAVFESKGTPDVLAQIMHDGCMLMAVESVKTTYGGPR